MKKALFILCLLVTITSCKAGGKTSTTPGNKKIASFEKSISSYSELSITGSGDVIYEQKASATPYLRIEVDENLKQYVKAEVKNGVLSISLDGNVQPSKFMAYTNSANLSKVKITGSGDVLLKGEVTSPSLNILITGSGDFATEKLQCNNLSVTLTGSGDARLGGSAINSEISISGSGDVDAGNLSTQNTKCSIAGSGDAKVYATERLDLSIAGSGDIKYKGSPKILNKSTRGSGDISPY